jgi:uncharacterized protein YjdB
VSVEAGQTRQLTAQVTDDQGNVLTGRPIIYSTSSSAIATVSAAGLVTGVAMGSAVITATSEGKTGTADVTVTPVPVATVEITPPNSDMTVGQSGQLTAIAKDARGTVLTGRPVGWSSGAPSVATISATGVVTAVGVGRAVVFASIEGRTASATVNVRQISVTSVTVAPASNTVAVGASVQLTATVRAGTTVLTDRVVGWTSSNDAVAVVSSTGRVTALKAGTVTITATSEGVSGTSSVAVGLASIETVSVAPATPNVIAGQTVQLTATAKDAAGNDLTGRTVTWASGNTLRATVNAQGLVTTFIPGKGTTVTITATSEGKSGSSIVTIQ